MLTTLRIDNPLPQPIQPTVSYVTGFLLAMAAGVCWSVIPLGVRNFEQANVWQILFYRSIGLLPMVWLLIQHQSAGKPVQAVRAIGYSGLWGAMGLVAAYAGGIGAIRLTSVANAAFLFATAPFLAALLSGVLLHERIRRSTWFAMGIAVVGIAIMVSDNVRSGHWLGDAVALLSAGGFAVFTVALRAGKERNSLPVVFIGGVLAIGVSAGVLLAQGQGLRVPVQDIVLALALGAFALGVGMVLYTIGSRAIPAGELALICMTEVLLAPIWAWLFLSEIPPWSILAGGGVLLLAIVINAVTGMRRRPLPPAF